jgi:hypothetical protein
VNTEERLRHASEEIERVTASLTPPPIGQVRRSTRLRNAGVALATALGAIVLVGGVVLALRPAGPTTLGLASPTDTTAPIFVDGIRVVIPALDPAPEFDLGMKSHEVPFQGLGEGFVDDVRTVSADPSVEWLDRIDEIVFLGASGEYRAYAIIGIFGENAPPGYSGKVAMCTVAFTIDETTGIDSTTGGCGDPSGGESVKGMLDIPQFSDRAAYIIYGRVDGASVVVIEIDGSRSWRRTREGYFFREVDGSVDSQVRYVVYDVDGSVLEERTFHAGEEPRDDPDTTVAPAVADDGSCSGGIHYPTTYPRVELPEPVVQTLGGITLFGSRCWFDELAGMAGDDFTASFGGGDPVELWASEEEQGVEPMHALMRILDMPHGTIELEDGLMYIWPAAAAHDGDWDSVPEEDKEALRTLYDEDDFATFADFGGYIGYRLGIAENGDWSFFVAGD